MPTYHNSGTAVPSLVTLSMGVVQQEDETSGEALPNWECGQLKGLSL